MKCIKSKVCNTGEKLLLVKKKVETRPKMQMSPCGQNIIFEVAIDGLLAGGLYLVDPAFLVNVRKTSAESPERVHKAYYQWIFQHEK